MKTVSRPSLFLALCALLLMLLTPALVPEAVPAVSGATVLAEHSGYRLLAGERPPGGTETFFDRETLLQGLLLYVGPDAPLPDDLPVRQTRDVRSLVRLYIPAAEHVALSEETIYALCGLMAEHPLQNIRITAGMRSPREQEALQRETFQQYQSTLPVAQALIRAQQDVPASGKSEHQLATAFDVRLEGVQEWAITDPMARTQEGRWLLENAWRYGFIRRYPPDKGEITGAHGEDGHFRYTGRAHAAAMWVGGLCLEEYLALLHDQGALHLVAEDRREAWLLCRPMTAQGAAFPVPAGWKASVSADNLGCAVCALTRD